MSNNIIQFNEKIIKGQIKELKVKALLRKFKARTLETLPDAIQRAFRAVTPSDCSGWFCACGYSS